MNTPEKPAGTGKSTLINDNQRLVSAQTRFGYSIPTYDDGYGKLYISRDSMGIVGIVRARTWEDAYSICEDEFFPEATETLAEIEKEYGFRREHRKVIRSAVNIPASERHPQLGAYEKFDEPSDYDNGKLPDGAFIRWVTIETPDPDAWADNELFQEAFGFRPNGPNVRDKVGHGIYAKDLNGDSLDKLTPELAQALGIVIAVEERE